MTFAQAALSFRTSDSDFHHEQWQNAKNLFLVTLLQGDIAGCIRILQKDKEFLTGVKLSYREIVDFEHNTLLHKVAISGSEQLYNYMVLNGYKKYESTKNKQGLAPYEILKDYHIQYVGKATKTVDTESELMKTEKGQCSVLEETIMVYEERIKQLQEIITDLKKNCKTLENNKQIILNQKRYKNREIVEINNKIKLIQEKLEINHKLYNQIFVSFKEKDYIKKNKHLDIFYRIVFSNLNLLLHGLLTTKNNLFEYNKNFIDDIVEKQALKAMSDIKSIWYSMKDTNDFIRSFDNITTAELLLNDLTKGLEFVEELPPRIAPLLYILNWGLKNKLRLLSSEITNDRTDVASEFHKISRELAEETARLLTLRYRNQIQHLTIEGIEQLGKAAIYRIAVILLDGKMLILNKNIPQEILELVRNIDMKDERKKIDLNFLGLEIPTGILPTKELSVNKNWQESEVYQLPGVIFYDNNLNRSIYYENDLFKIENGKLYQSFPGDQFTDTRKYGFMYWDHKPDGMVAIKDYELSERALFFGLNVDEELSKQEILEATFMNAEEIIKIEKNADQEIKDSYQILDKIGQDAVLNKQIVEELIECKIEASYAKRLTDMQSQLIALKDEQERFEKRLEKGKDITVIDHHTNELIVKIAELEAIISRQNQDEMDYKIQISLIKNNDWLKIYYITIFTGLNALLQNLMTSNSNFYENNKSFVIDNFKKYKNRRKIAKNIKIEVLPENKVAKEIVTEWNKDHQPNDLLFLFNPINNQWTGYWIKNRKKEIEERRIKNVKILAELNNLHKGNRVTSEQLCMLLRKASLFDGLDYSCITWGCTDKIKNITNSGKNINGYIKLVSDSLNGVNYLINVENCYLPDTSQKIIDGLSIGVKYLAPIVILAPCTALSEFSQWILKKWSKEKIKDAVNSAANITITEDIRELSERTARLLTLSYEEQICRLKIDNVKVLADNAVTRIAVAFLKREILLDAKDISAEFMLAVRSISIDENPRTLKLFFGSKIEIPFTQAPLEMVDAKDKKWSANGVYQLTGIVCQRSQYDNEPTDCDKNQDDMTLIKKGNTFAAKYSNVNLDYKSILLNEFRKLLNADEKDVTLVSLSNESDVHKAKSKIISSPANNSFNSITENRALVKIMEGDNCYETAKKAYHKFLTTKNQTKKAKYLTKMNLFFETASRRYKENMPKIIEAHIREQKENRVKKIDEGKYHMIIEESKRKNKR